MKIVSLPVLPEGYEPLELVSVHDEITLDVSFFRGEPVSEAVAFSERACLDALKQMASALGADAIVDLKTDYLTLTRYGGSSSRIMIKMHGTAIRKLP